MADDNMTHPIERASVEQATPAARWREEGKPDPHGNSYDCERSKLCGGHLSDDEVAFQTAMLMRSDLNHEGVLQTARDRIRWLSRKLVEAEAHRQQARDAGFAEGVERAAAWHDQKAADYRAHYERSRIQGLGFSNGSSLTRADTHEHAAAAIRTLSAKANEGRCDVEGGSR